jgi:hypothetical protein
MRTGQCFPTVSHSASSFPHLLLPRRTERDRTGACWSWHSPQRARPTRELRHRFANNLVRTRLARGGNPDQASHATPRRFLLTLRTPRYSQSDPDPSGIPGQTPRSPCTAASGPRVRPLIGSVASPDASFAEDADQKCGGYALKRASSSHFGANSRSPAFVRLRWPGPI